MTNEHLAAQHYLKTNILGAYETADIIWQSDSEGTSHRTFADSFVYTDETSHTIERDMVSTVLASVIAWPASPMAVLSLSAASLICAVVPLSSLAFFLAFS